MAMATVASWKARKSQVARIVRATFPEYGGRTFKVNFTETVTFFNLNWGGGTRNQYKAVSCDGKTLSLGAEYGPWNNPVEGMTVRIPQNVLIVEHSIFCGQDRGIRIYSHPANMPHWLPQASQRGG
jgi:hypothetical protein